MIGTVFKEQMRSGYTQHFEATKNLQPDWLRAIREQAFHSFYRQDLPTKKSEAWRYTSLARLDELPVKDDGPVMGDLRVGENLQKDLIQSPYTFFFVNGRWVNRNEISMDGLQVKPLSSAWNDKKVRACLNQDETLFTALNTGFLEEGCFISVSPQAVIDAPVVLVFATIGPHPISLFPRVVIEVGEKAKLTVAEHFLDVDGATTFTNALTQINLENQANLNYYKIQKGCHHISTTLVHQKNNSHFLSFFSSEHAAFVRNDLRILLQESDAEACLLGLYSVEQKEQVDNHVEIKHVTSKTKSRTLYHGILNGEAKAVFNGKISVGQHIKEVDAALNNHNLLLGEDAEIDTKPELEIYSDDVKCSHGATVGALDEDALFYLRSRGIASDTACEILKEAFMERVLLKIPDKAVAVYLRGNLV